VNHCLLTYILKAGTKFTCCHIFDSALLTPETDMEHVFDSVKS